MRPKTIQDYLVKLHSGQWFKFSGNLEYANLVILDDTKTKPTEQECIDGLAQLQSDYDAQETNRENKKASAITKLKELGLDDDEIKAIKEVV